MLTWKLSSHKIRLCSDCVLHNYKVTTKKKKKKKAVALQNAERENIKVWNANIFSLTAT